MLEVLTRQGEIEETSNQPPEFEYELLEPLEIKNCERTVKCLFSVPRLAEKTPSFMGSTVETVVVHGTRRDSVCVSCCSGCNEGCAYCLTGNYSDKERLKAKELNLTAGEMVEEFRASLAIGRSQWSEFGEKGLAISFMGRGEPGRNPGPIMEATAILFKAGDIVDSSISTIGRLDFFQQFSKAYSNARKITDFPLPHMGISILSPIDSQRKALGKYPKNTPPSIEEVLTRLAEDYIEPNAKNVFFRPGIRFTLLSFPNGEVNYNDEALEILAGLVLSFKEKYGRDFLVIVATLNESPASESRRLRPPSWDTALEVTRKLNAKGISAHLFGDDPSGLENASCTCGLLAAQWGKKLPKPSLRMFLL